VPPIEPTGKGRNYKFWVGIAQFPAEPLVMGAVVTDWDEKPVERLEAHTHFELMIPVKTPVVIIVSEPSDVNDASAKPKAEKAKAFLIKPGEGILIEAGTWHYVPMPLEGEGFCFFMLNPNVKGIGHTNVHMKKFENSDLEIVKKP